MHFLARFGIEASFGCFPTYILVTLKQKGAKVTQSLTLSENSQMSFNIEKLELAEQLAKKVANKKITVAQGVLELKAINDQYLILLLCFIYIIIKFIIFFLKYCSPKLFF